MQMPNEEQLVIRVTLTSAVLKSGKVPEYEILIDGVIVQSGTANPDSASKFVVTVATTLVNGEHTLGVRFINKNSKFDTIIDANGKIVDDLYLVVEKVEVDDIDLGHNVLEKSTYTLDRPVGFNGAQISQLTKHNFLSWNGTWSLSFTSPFYLWLLENL